MIWDATATGRCGRRQTYSDTAIQNCLTMKVLFGMDLRQTTDSIESLLCLIGPSWPVPDFSTLSRRQKTLAVNVPYRGSKGPLHLLSDSTGIKIKGEGEWSAEDPNTLWGTVFPTNAQAWRFQVASLAPDPSRN
ncbi:DDE family transposase [Tritonibacter scottomollicae]|uniref:DDE family transposase n=1 Tax=Tritonibacter scottomollicae TaxID=483013 RepID=A0A2T1ALF9_TRISK|nr:DDE family transposase [Tritonibacter scottomollicae]